MIDNLFNNNNAYALIKQFGSPLYVYDEAIIRQRCRELRKAFSSWKKTKLHYAAKANSNLNILKIIHDEGFCLDAVSIYEAELGILADFSPDQIFHF